MTCALATNLKLCTYLGKLVPKNIIDEDAKDTMSDAAIFERVRSVMANVPMGIFPAEFVRILQVSDEDDYYGEAEKGDLEDQEVPRTERLWCSAINGAAVAPSPRAYYTA